MDKSQERVGAHSANTDHGGLQKSLTEDGQQLGAILQSLQDEIAHLRDRVDDQAIAHQKAFRRPSYRSSKGYDKGFRRPS